MLRANSLSDDRRLPQGPRSPFLNRPAPETVDQVVIRFAGDSGDGMQLLGGQFTRTTALAGNDIATFPDFPAEIRAPAGTREGVSGFQLHFAGRDIFEGDFLGPRE